MEDMFKAGVKEAVGSHDRQLDEPIRETSVQMQERINDAEDKKEMPKTALVLSHTTCKVVWGDEEEIRRFKKNWVKMKSSGLPHAQKQSLKDLGKAMMFRPLRDGVQIWDVLEAVHIEPNPDAKKRLAENAQRDNQSN